MVRARAVPFQLTPPPAPTPATPAQPARAARAPGLLPSLLPDVPLSDLHLRRIRQLEELGAYEGWGEEGRGGLVFVDHDGQRFHGPTLHVALGRALRAARSSP